MSLPSFHRLQVSQKRRITSDSVAVSFFVPPELREAYRFTQGQFITLRQNFDGVAQRRSYSVCISVDDYAQSGQLQVGVKRVAGGLFSNWVAQSLNCGDHIEVMTPDGRFFTPLSSTHAKHYVAFAGGSGITPVLSLIKTTLAAEPRSEFTLIYGNRSVASIMFIEALEDLKNLYLARLRLVHVLSDEPQEIALFNGLLDRSRCDALLSELVPASSIDEAFICGPEPMMDAAQAALLAAGVPAARVHVERFGVPMPASTAAGAATTATTSIALTGTAANPSTGGDAPRAEVELIVEGKSRRLSVERDGMAILEAGLAAGIDLPYACKGGVCCTCRAKVIEGSVRMDKNYTLEDWEMKLGFVLTCQSHPTSERVVISYDER